MKKTSLLITIVLALFIYSPAFAQKDAEKELLANEIKKKALEIVVLDLSITLSANRDKIKDAEKELLAIQNSNASLNIYMLIQNVSRVVMIHEYLWPIVSLRQYVREDSLESYNKILYAYLVSSKEKLEVSIEYIQVFYSRLEIMAAMYATDKVKPDIRDSINKIESTLKLLSNATK